MCYVCQLEYILWRDECFNIWNFLLKICQTQNLPGSIRTESVGFLPESSCQMSHNSMLKRANMASKANSFNVTKRCFVWHIFLFLPEDDFVVYDQKMYKKITQRWFKSWILLISRAPVQTCTIRTLQRRGGNLWIYYSPKTFREKCSTVNWRTSGHLWWDVFFVFPILLDWNYFFVSWRIYCHSIERNYSQTP